MRLGTRGSALALAQAQPIADKLGAQLVVIRTSGDSGVGGPTDKQRWVDTIEQALLDDEIDVAVHSAKDVPGQLAEGLKLIAATARADPRDALVGAGSIDELRPGARVGTSSPRRRAQLLAVRDDLDVFELTGNVDTRLQKLARGEADAIVLAAAGLIRLGRHQEIGAMLDPTRFVPAPGQGSLALEARAESQWKDLGGSETFAALEIEREIARLLGADCHSAVGIHCDGPTTRAWVGKADGSAWIQDELESRDAREIARRMLSAGARAFLA